MANKYVFWRIISLVLATWISVFFGLSILSLQGIERTIYLYALIPISAFMIYTIIHLMLFPLDLRIYVVWIFIFSLLSMAYGSSAVSVMILYCGLVIGHHLHTFTTKKILKFSTLGILYIVCVCFQLRLDNTKRIESLMELLCATSTIVTMQIFMKHIIKRINRDIFGELPHEDINTYFKEYAFTERDKKMLEEVLSGCKYEEIAANHNLSLSSVKKRLAFLYKKLGVSCQIDFLIKFAGKADNSTKV